MREKKEKETETKERTKEEKEDIPRAIRWTFYHNNNFYLILETLIETL